MHYAAPTTVDEARTLLEEHPGSRVFAGATDVVPQMRAGRTEPTVLVDLKRIDRLMTVDHADGQWTIGAAVPTGDLTRNDDFRAMFPGITEAAGLIGSDQIQNRSSLGGNLCNGSPAADSVPAMIASQARAVVAGAAGERIIPIADVVTGPGRLSLGADEFVVEFQIDDAPDHTGDAYLRMTPRTEMDIAVVGVAVRVTMDGDTCTDARVVLGAVAPTALRVPDAEAALIGSTLDDDTLAAVAAAASAAADPIDDKRGTVAYRTQVAGTLARRAAVIAAERARS